MISMSNQIFGSSAFSSPFKSKRPKPSDEVKAIQNSLTSGVKKQEDLSEEELFKLTAFESADKIAFETEIREEQVLSERIAMKIAKGEPLTQAEEDFMNQKYPDLMREAKQAKQEGDALKERLKAAKSEDEQQQIVSGAMSNVSNLANKGQLSGIQLRMKVAVIQQAQEEERKEREGRSGKGISLVQNTFAPGTFFNERI